MQNNNQGIYPVNVQKMRVNAIDFSSKVLINHFSNLSVQIQARLDKKLDLQKLMMDLPISNEETFGTSFKLSTPTPV